MSWPLPVVVLRAMRQGYWWTWETQRFRKLWRTWAGLCSPASSSLHLGVWHVCSFIPSQGGGHDLPWQVRSEASPSRPRPLAGLPLQVLQSQNRFVSAGGHREFWWKQPEHQANAWDQLALWFPQAQSTLSSGEDNLFLGLIHEDC